MYKKRLFTIIIAVTLIFQMTVISRNSFVFAQDGSAASEPAVSETVNTEPEKSEPVVSDPVKKEAAAAEAQPQDNSSQQVKTAGDEATESTPAKKTVNIYIKGLTKDVNYNGEEQYFPGIDGKDAFLDVKCDYNDGIFDINNIGCNFIISGTHVGEYSGKLSAENFSVNKEKREYYDSLYEINYIIDEVMPLLRINKTKITVTSPSVTAKYVDGKVLYTGDDVKVVTALENGLLPIGEGYQVKEYTSLSAPGKVTNVVRIVIGKQSLTDPGQLVDYEEIDGVRYYFSNDYDVTYDWGTLWLTGQNNGAGNSTGNDGTGTATATGGDADGANAGGALNTGDTVKVTGATNAYISDGKTGYTVKKLASDDAVPLENLLLGGANLWMIAIPAIVLLLALLLVLMKRRKKSGN